MKKYPQLDIRVVEMKTAAIKEALAKGEIDAGIVARLDDMDDFNQTSGFGRYLAVGIAGIFFTHCFINIGMSIGLAPVTGLSLPFVSYGGSFMLTGLAGCGLLQSVYRFRNSR